MYEHLKTMNLEKYVSNDEGSVTEDDVPKQKIIDNLSTDEVQKAQQAFSMLLSSISGEEIAKATHCTTAKSIWDHFKQTYGSKSSNLKLELMNELSSTTFKTAKEVPDGLNKILATRGKLRNLNVEIDDITILDLVIKGLPKSFSNFLSNW